MTKQELQHVVNLAGFYLMIHSARLYGLIQGGPEINTDQCQKYIDIGKAASIYPDKDFIDPELNLIPHSHEHIKEKKALQSPETN